MNTNVMDPALEKNQIPNLPRTVRIWIASHSERSKISLGFQGGHQQVMELDGTCHHGVQIPQQDIQQDCVTIEVLEGNISVGQFEINYSWCINPYFYDTYDRDTVDKFIRTEFDVSILSPEFFSDLLRHDFFQSTGPDGFSATVDLRYDLQVNQDQCALEPWIFLASGDHMRCRVYITTPVAFHWLHDKNQVHRDDIDFGMIQHYDEDFIRGLDTRYYEFVNKKLRNRHTPWAEATFSEYRVPYSLKTRIQAQLLDNERFIRDRHVVDLGCERGRFLFACLAMDCASITGVQPVEEYNAVINETLMHLELQDRGRAVHGNAYDLVGLKQHLQGKNTLLMLGLIYHLNNHYQLLEMISQTSLDALIIDISVPKNRLDHYRSPVPAIQYQFERHGIDNNGWELAEPSQCQTFVGMPNAAWLITVLEHLGWRVRSSKMQSMIGGINLMLLYRGIITLCR